MTKFEPHLSSAPAGTSFKAPTFADLLDAVSADEGLTQRQRTDLRSAIKTFCKWFHRIPADTPASPSRVRSLLAGSHPIQHDVSRGRWNNVISSIRKAMERYGSQPLGRHRIVDIEPRWRDLVGQLASPDLRYGLSRFIKFCSIESVAPEDVNLAAFARFETRLDEIEFHKSPTRVARASMTRWNKACRTVAGWPGQEVERTPAREAYCLPWTDINLSFCKDVDAWISRLGDDNWRDDDAPLRPLRVASLDARRFQMRQAYSILVRAGQNPDSLTGLADIVCTGNAEIVLRFFLERKDDQPHSQVAGMAATLLTIARHHVKADEATVRALARMKRRVTPSPTGLTEKNRATIRQFDESRNIERLLMLPFDLADQARRSEYKAPHKAALLMQTAVAIEVLLMMPIRLSNLAHLDIETRFDWRGDKLMVVIPQEQVKNREPIEFSLEGESLRLLRNYLDRHRGRTGLPSAWLFPGAKEGQPKSDRQLARQIKDTILRHTGLVVTPHQFRHIAAHIWLDQNPGAYEALRRLLCHRSMATTTGSYSGMENKKAAQEFDHMIWNLRSNFSGRRAGT